jgi:AhpD family alkylhydroperoxidase
MVLRLKERELAAVGISVATGCKPCTDYHVKAARKARASDDEIGRAVAAALSVRTSATAIMEAHALAHLGEAGHGGGTGGGGETDRAKVLVSVGAALGVNCTSSLDKHLAAARAIGISDQDVADIVKLAVFIKGMAASHVNRMAGVEEARDDRGAAKAGAT